MNSGELKMTEIIQKSGMGSSAVQIGVQNNIGLSVNDAVQMAVNLFMENFPKFEKRAREIADERIKEMVPVIVEKIYKKGCLTEQILSDPGMQYILLKGQSDYVRYGNSETLNVLGDLVAERAVSTAHDYSKIIFDEAIEKVGSLNKEHLNFMTLIFLTKHVGWATVLGVDELSKLYEQILSDFPVPNNIKDCTVYLIMRNLLNLRLGDAFQEISKRYNYPIEQVKEKLPKILECVPGDYGLSPVGIVLAVVNFNSRYHTLNVDEYVEGKIDKI